MITQDRSGRAPRERGSSTFGKATEFGGRISRELLVGYLLGADFNITTDQAITITAGYRVTKITVTNASISLDTASGGFYSEAAKAGTELVAAAQVYSALTAPTITLDCTIAAIVAGLTTVYFSLTVAQGAAATADIRIYGVAGNDYHS